MDWKDRIGVFTSLRMNLASLDKDQLNALCLAARNENGWFTHESVISALNEIKNWLHRDNLENWLSKYNVSHNDPKTIGLIAPGNIPLVSFHDLMCVTLSGHRLKVKLSSSDSVLIRFICQQLIDIEPEIKKYITLTDRFKDIDAVIATGSNNSSRYFEYYFGKYPHIIRKNRTSIALLNGSETSKEFQYLSDDIFAYYGLGCRNVSKVWVPKGYDFNLLLGSLDKHKEVIMNHKYANNYDYNKSIYLVNKEPFLDNGFLLLKESKDLVSPISVLYYDQYKNENDLKFLLEENKKKLQCILTSDAWLDRSIPFGTAQKPNIDDYADNVDTMQFLTGLT